MSAAAPWLAACALLGCVAVAAIAAPSDNTATPVPATQSARWLDFVRAVQTDYVREVDEPALRAACANAVQVLQDDPASACIQAAMALLDPHSEFIAPQAWAELTAAPRGGFVGIGLELARKARGEPLRVVSPIEGGPAQRAGLRAGDLLLEIDGVDLRPLTVDEAVKVMRGEAGSPVRVTLQRAGLEAPLTLSATREPIRLQTVRAAAWPGGLLYARVSQFRQDTGRTLVDLLNALVPAPQPAPAGLVLDLRGNTGGLLDAVTEVAGVFAPLRQVVLNTIGRQGSEAQSTHFPRGGGARWAADEASAAWRQAVPLLVLIDARTASGAEALAQFLRETRGARLVGQRSAGLDYIRTQRTLGGDAALLLVHARMRSAKGADWSGGLQPDVPLQTQAEAWEYGAPEDRALQHALTLLRAEAPPR